ncbi:hypothetical protein [Microbacterium sp.]|uniref:hypothetical protein n=1 Tax=Microbacterium sp. TaxID=51671 RepID=UPI003A8D5899
MSEKSMCGSIRAALSGGPLDGAQYGDLPDVGAPKTSVRLSIPLTQPAESAARAVYICRRPGKPEDVWQFEYDKTVLPEFPTGTSVSFK